MYGQGSRIKDWGSPRLAIRGLGDGLIKRYWKWRSEAHEDLKKKGESSPNFVESGTSFGDDPE